MKKIIIFGASGNVGSYFVKYASEYFDRNEYEIIPSGRRETDVFEQFDLKYISVDISRIEEFKKLPSEDIYAVILIAATIPSYMKGYKPEEYLYSNTIGAFNVLEYCRRVRADRILYTQTVFDIALYPRNKVLSPDLPLNFSYIGDHAMYVISKNAAIEMIKHYYEEYGIKKFIFRLPTIYCYSPYQYYYSNGERKMRPVYTMINNAINSRPVELWGDPNYSKDMVHVYDFSQMLCKAVEVNSISEGMYNVGTGMPVTMQEQIETIIDVFSPKDNPSKIIYKPEKISTGGRIMDISNAKKQLGYIPQYSCRKLLKISNKK